MIRYNHSMSESKKIRVNYLLICESTITDENKKLSIINIFNALEVDDLPTSPSKFNAVFEIEVDRKDIGDGKLALDLVITDNEGRAIMKVTGKARLVVSSDLEVGVFNSSLPIDGNLIIKSKGEHRLALIMNGVELASRSFLVESSKEKK
jgi:hypothetical protein